jgi:hypothetical protein
MRSPCCLCVCSYVSVCLFPSLNSNSYLNGVHHESVPSVIPTLQGPRFCYCFSANFLYLSRYLLMITSWNEPIAMLGWQATHHVCFCFLRFIERYTISVLSPSNVFLNLNFRKKVYSCYYISFIAVSNFMLRDEQTLIYLCSVTAYLIEVKRIVVMLVLSIPTSNHY